MARQTRKWNPGDAANAFVRVILSDAGQLLGGLSDEEWAKTMIYFGGRCAYTGERLEESDIERDHAIPMNRAHAGLHLFGNVLPTSKATNRRKRDAHYRKFVDDDSLRERIDRFMRETKYVERIATLGDIRHYCAAQYEAIDALCRVNRSYLESLLPEAESDPGEAHAEPSPTRARPRRGPGRTATLPIKLHPEPESAFKVALLREKRAWIVVYYRDGHHDVAPWRAENFRRTSGVMGNLRSRPQFRAGAWQKAGISRVEVFIQRPPGL